jgi:hypothetical protein
VEARDAYLRSVHRAAAPGAQYYILGFDVGAFPREFEARPNEVSEDELRDAVSKYWHIDGIRLAFIHAYTPQIHGTARQSPLCAVQDR